MSNPNLRAGRMYLKIDGVQHSAKGSFTYNLGGEKREAIVGADGVHGYKSSPIVPFIEGEITDNAGLDLAALTRLDGATVTLELANGKVIVLSDAWYAADGDAQTEDANIQVRFEGLRAEETK